MSDRNTKKKTSRGSVRAYKLVDPASQTLKIYFDNRADPDATVCTSFTKAG